MRTCWNNPDLCKKAVQLCVRVRSTVHFTFEMANAGPKQNLRFVKTRNLIGLTLYRQFCMLSTVDMYVSTYHKLAFFRK